MQVKLLSLVAEEMTSLSRIIRGVQAQEFPKHTVEIQLRNMFVSEPNDSMDDHQEHQLTHNEILAERDRLLLEAKHQIEQERSDFENYQATQLATLEELKVLWEEEKKQLQQKAYEEAFSQGYEEGIQKASSSMEQSLKVANETMDLARINADKYIEDQEKVILDLALKCAGKIIGYEIDQNEEAFVSVIKRALKEVRELQNIKVYVSQEHYALVSKYRDELAEMFPPDVQFLIFVNEDFQTLESYIETNHGRVIVSIDDQLQELRIKLNELLDSKE